MIKTSHLSQAQRIMLNSLMSKKNAPLEAHSLDYLWKCASDVRKSNNLKGYGLNSVELQGQQEAAQDHFSLGCWLHFYSLRIAQTNMLACRIDCMRRILLSDLTDFMPRNLFLAAFDFGEEHGQRIFDMGDGDAVQEALLPLQSIPCVRAKFEQAGWLTKNAEMEAA